MADTKISGLPASTTPLAGTEVLPIVQSSSTVQVSVANLTAGRAVATGALTVTGALSATGTLSGGTSGTGYSFSGSAPAGSLTLNSSGNLLVGTTSSTGVTVAAFKRAGDALLEISANNGTPGTDSLAVGQGGTNVAYVYQRANQPLVFGTNNTERARIDSSGIFTMNAYGAGAATFSAAGVISSVSDETWKIKDGVPTDPDAMLKKLEPGYWYYNEEKAPTFGADRQLGFYAQNVNAAIGPEAAPTPEEGKPWGYYDRSVLAITVMSLQKALATIETLTARVAQLESKA